MEEKEKKGKTRRKGKERRRKEERKKERCVTGEKEKVNR